MSRALRGRLGLLGSLGFGEVSTQVCVHASLGASALLRFPGEAPRGVLILALETNLIVPNRADGVGSSCEPPGSGLASAMTLLSRSCLGLA